MQESTFNELADLALRHSGQVFQPSRSYLMEARLSAISRRESFATLDDLVHCLKARPNQRFEHEIAAALTGKLTRFFRHREQLDQIVSHALPERLKLSKTGRLRVWCAGVATGQEAWSMMMRLTEDVGSALSRAEIEIIGTDISTGCLETAKGGTYGHYDVQKGLSIHRLMANFQRRDTGEWEIRDSLRENVSFRRHNLIESARDLGQFDLILCRNVLSGMAKPIQTKVVENMTEQLLPGGFLFATPDENLIAVAEDLKLSRDVRGAYERRPKSNKSEVA